MTKQQGDLEQAALIFERARELEGDARRAYLDEACNTNTALRADILSMLEAEADLVMLGVGAVPVDAPAESEREDDPEPPARGGCASCNIGAPTQPSAGSRGDAPAPQLALGALLAMLVLRQRCRPGPRR